MEEEKRLSWKNVIIWTGGDGPCRVFDIYNYIDISKLWLNMNSRFNEIDVNYLLNAFL